MSELPVAPRPVRRRTLAVEVADALRDMILTGELLPGSRPTQIELAKLLGVSTMPIREALLRLAAEGFVELESNRAFTVARTTREDVRDVYWVHATLAGELASRACARADAEVLQGLHSASEAFLDAQRIGDAEGLGAANWSFHRAINHAACAPKLLLVLRSTLRFIPDRFYALVPEWAAESVRGHDAILEAVERRDPNDARRAAEAHVRDAGELLITFFTVKGYWAKPNGPVLDPDAHG